MAAAMPATACTVSCSRDLSWIVIEERLDAVKGAEFGSFLILCRSLEAGGD
jgi:hypothetical protein